MSNIAEPEPPIIEPWRVALLFVTVALIVWFVHGLAPARAETIGWRIEIEACRGGTCRPLPRSSQRWGGLFACQDRAALLRRLAGDLPPRLLGLPRGNWRIGAACVPITGFPSA